MLAKFFKAYKLSAMSISAELSPLQAMIRALKAGRFDVRYPTTEDEGLTPLIEELNELAGDFANCTGCRRSRRRSTRGFSSKIPSSMTTLPSSSPMIASVVPCSVTRVRGYAPSGQ